MKIKMGAGSLARAERGPADVHALMTFADAYRNILKHTQTVTKPRTGFFILVRTRCLHEDRNNYKSVFLFKID